MNYCPPEITAVILCITLKNHKGMDMNESRPKRMALIASKGTLDSAYPPFMLASTAVAMEMEVADFYFLGTSIAQ